MAAKTLLPLIVQLLDGLSAAHDAGILHRDLKPANLFLLNDRRQRDFLKILDFGVSKVMGLSGDDTTNTGVMLGTPRYMSPEQAKGEKDIDVRTDIYSVGVIMYRGLTAKAPYEADTFNELLFKVVLEDPPSVSERVDDIEPEVAAFVAKAMARDKDERFASADEMATLLRAWLSAQGVDVPPPPPRRQSVHSGEPLSVSGRRPNNDGHLSGSTKLSAAMDRDEAPTRTVRRSRSRWYLGAAVVVIAGAAFAARGVIMGSVLDGGAATPTVTQEQAPATDDLDTAIGAPEPHADAAAPSAALEPSAAPDTSAAPETSAAAAPSALPIAPPVATVPHKTPHATPAPHPTPSPPGVRRKYRKEL
jgi:serine/threonine-protein kinase